jgi:hypothetical protein
MVSESFERAVNLSSSELQIPVRVLKSMRVLPGGLHSLNRLVKPFSTDHVFTHCAEWAGCPANLADPHAYSGNLRSGQIGRLTEGHLANIFADYGQNFA